jgi:hypothetical protein
VGEPGHADPVRRALITVAVLVMALLTSGCAASNAIALDAQATSSAVSPLTPSSAASRPTPAAASKTGGTGATVTIAGVAVPASAGDVAAIRRSIGAINATAGGPVADQRAVLNRLAAPSEAGLQKECPAAQSTIRLDPVYTDLRSPPDDGSLGPTTTAASAAAGGITATGTAGVSAQREYLLPALITVFTGNRITATDLTTLQLFVMNGTARTAHLCVS